MPTSTACLDDEVLVRLATRAAGPDELERARDHLDSCETCSGALLALMRESRPGDATAPPSRLAGALPAGTKLGRFTLRDVLGSGGMGTVFTAHDPQLGRDVAIKILRAGRTDEHFATRLAREAKAMAQVRHPNVVTVYEVGRDADVIFIAMEQIRGPTLRAALAASRPSIAVLLDWLAQVALGLEAVHAAGLVHRDLKPDNVFVEDVAAASGSGRAQRVVLGDFGLAVGTERADRSGHEPGSVTATRAAGTPAYMPPEQLRGEPLDARADVFAFGVMAWEVLAGERPFAGTTPEALEEAIRKGAPHANVLRGVPAAVARSIAACLAYARDARPAAIGDVLRHLTAPPPWRRRRVVAAGVALTAAAAALGAVAFAGEPARTTILACDPVPAARWQRTRPTWLPAAAALSPFVRDSIAATMDRRSEAWRAAASTACRRDVIAQQAFRACRRRLEGIEDRVLALSVERRWADDRLLQLAFDELEPPAYCVSSEAAEDAVAASRLPTDAARASVDDGLAWIARAHALARVRSADQVSAALAEAERVATAVAPSPLDGELALSRARLQPKAAPAEQMAALEAAAAKAERSGRASLIARAWLALAYKANEFQLDATIVDRAHQQADWAITRLGDPPRLRARWLAIAGVIAWARTDRATAMKRLAESASISGDDPLLAYERLGTLARFAVLAGDNRQAAAIYAELLANATFVASTSARELTLLHRMHADALYAIGEHADAAVALQRATALAATHLRPEDPDRIGIDSLLGTIRFEQGDLRGAATLLASAKQRFVGALGPDHPLVGNASLRLAQVLVKLERRDEGASAATDAIRIFDAQYGRTNEWSIAARAHLASSIEEPTRRAELSAEVLRDAKAHYGTAHPMWAQHAAMHGTVLVRIARHDEARPLFEAAIPILERAGMSRQLRAHAQFELARMIAATDPARAHTLATAAETTLRPDGPRHSDVAAWLREHRR